MALIHGVWVNRKSFNQIKKIHIEIQNFIVCQSWIESAIDWSTINIKPIHYLHPFCTHQFRFRFGRYQYKYWDALPLKPFQFHLTKTIKYYIFFSSSVFSLKPYSKDKMFTTFTICHNRRRDIGYMHLVCVIQAFFPIFFKDLIKPHRPFANKEKKKKKK